MSRFVYWRVVDDQGYVLIEYATLDEAKSAIAGTVGKKLLGQPISADFAFTRGPKADRGNRVTSGVRRASRRGRSQSPDVTESKGLASRIEA